MRDRASRQVFVTFIVGLLAIGTLIQFLEPHWFGITDVSPFDFRAMLTDCIYVGSAAPVCGLLIWACGGIKRGEVFDRANLVVIGMTIVAISLAGQRLWWLIWRDQAHPEWMRTLHSAWLIATIIGGTFIFAGGETIHGRVAPRAWLTWLGVSGVVIAIVLAAFVFWR